VDVQADSRAPNSSADNVQHAPLHVLLESRHNMPSIQGLSLVGGLTCLLAPESHDLVVLCCSRDMQAS